MAKLVTQHDIERCIFVIRSKRVMIDRDLAILYGVKTKYLNQQVRRNIDRFSEEFMFQLTSSEKEQLVAICNQFSSMKHTRATPLAFTEYGVLMAATILNSEHAIRTSKLIIRTFVRIREVIASHQELAVKFTELENKVNMHDKDIIMIFQAINKLMAPEPKESKGTIGFQK
jgi:hypothetical protein